MQVGDALIGTFGMYRADPRTLTDRELATAGRFAAATAHAVLEEMATSAGDPRTVAEPDAVDGELQRAEVYQASGIVMVQLGVPIDEALVRLRAHAIVNDQPIREVARAVVARTVRFSRDNDLDRDGGDAQ